MERFAIEYPLHSVRAEGIWDCGTDHSPRSQLRSYKTGVEKPAAAPGPTAQLAVITQQVYDTVREIRETENLVFKMGLCLVQEDSNFRR